VTVAVGFGLVVARAVEVAVGVGATDVDGNTIVGAVGLALAVELAGAVLTAAGA
jgi:hypothetical protein